MEDEEITPQTVESDETVEISDMSDRSAVSDMPDESDTTATVEPPTVEPPTAVDDLIAEAEQRGYLRGLNEAAARRMAAPTLWGSTLSMQDMPPRREYITDPDNPDLFIEGFLSDADTRPWD